MRERIGRRSGAARAGALVLAVVLGLGLLSACDTSPVVLQGTITVAGGGSPAGITVDAFSNESDTLVAQAVTDAGGRYRFRSSRLAAGTYRIRLGDGTWWQGASTWAAATPVTVGPDPATTIDVEVAAPSGSMSGTLTSLHGRPVVGATVEARTLDGSVTVATGTSTAQGTFTLAGLPATSYSVRVSATGHAAVWFGGATTAAASTPVVVQHGQATPGVDLVAPPASRLTGAVRAHGDRAGLAVVAAEAGTGTQVAAAVTDSIGRFTIGGLPAGTYTIGVTDPGGRYRPTAHGSTWPDLGSGTPFTVATGATTTVGEIPVSGADCPIGSRGADLTGADLAGAALAGCDLTGTRLDGADLSGADLTGAMLASAKLVDADLRGADLDGAVLLAADLTGADLSDASTQATSIRASAVTGTDFGTAPLGAISSGSVVGTPARLPSDWSMEAGHLVGPNAVLTGAGLAGRDLRARDLRGANLTSANLTGSDLGGADLTGATLANAKLTGADVDGALLAGATLRGATAGGLVGTPAAMPAGWVLHAGVLFGERAVVTGTDVDGIDLSGAELVGITTGGLTGTPAALPPGWALVDGFLFGPAVTIAGADFDGADLSAVDLKGARTSSLAGVPAALPAGWIAYGGHLVGATAQLRNAQLGGLDAPGIDLSGANLTGADLGGADLTGSNLTNTFLANTTLTGADLTGADLTGTNLAGAEVTDAHLASTVVASVYSGGLRGDPASLPADRAIVNGFLLGPAAQATNADLRGGDLGGLDLSGAVLLRAKLDSSDLTGSDLSGANLVGVTFDGATVAGADLTGADLTEASGVGIVGQPSVLPAGWELLGGELVGPFW